MAASEDADCVSPASFWINIPVFADSFSNLREAFALCGEVGHDNIPGLGSTGGSAEATLTDNGVAHFGEAFGNLAVAVSYKTRGNLSGDIEILREEGHAILVVAHVTFDLVTSQLDCFDLVNLTGCWNEDSTVAVSSKTTDADCGAHVVDNDLPSVLETVISEYGVKHAFDVLGLIDPVQASLSLIDAQFSGHFVKIREAYGYHAVGQLVGELNEVCVCLAIILSHEAVCHGVVTDCNCECDQANQALALDIVVSERIEQLFCSGLGRVIVSPSVADVAPLGELSLGLFEVNGIRELGVGEMAVHCLLEPLLFGGDVVCWCNHLEHIHFLCG